MRVDLPTPDEPSRATVRPGSRNGARSPSPSPALAAVTITGAPWAMASISRRRASGSPARSDLLSTTTGTAPFSRVRSRARSSRRGLKSRSSPATRKTVSMLAARTCSFTSSPAALRAKRLRRGSTATTWPRSAPGVRRSATQSPTTGSSERASAS